MLYNFSVPPGMYYSFVIPVMMPTNNTSGEGRSVQPCPVGSQQCQLPEQIQNQSSYLNLNESDLQKAGYQSKKKAWTEEEDRKLRKYYEKDQLDWPQIADLIPGRNAKMCYSRYRRLQNQTKIQWKKAQDEKLCQLVGEKGTEWRQISKNFPGRTHKQVKEHYLNYLRPQIRKDDWTLEEDMKLVELINKNGKNWKMIEQHFQGRTQNQIKNRYFGRLKKLAERKAKVQNQTNTNRKN